MDRTQSDIEGALRAWRDLLGPEHLLTDAQNLRAAETATFKTDQKIPAVLRPADREEVQECVRIANRFGVAIYTVSSGMNWGYGSRVPASSGSVLMELGRMNRILDYSEDLAYVTVEPGVTQKQLIEFLRQQNSRLWIDATGSSPNSSIIGNTVERGFGHTPYGDHFDNVCGLEVILPDGECLDTGFARFDNARTAATYKWGLGPSLDGLFSQSNLGIVTRMTVWLMPAPEHFQAYFFRCDEEGDLGCVIDALRPLRINGTIRSAVHIGNDYKVLSSIQRYPWEETAGEVPLSPELMKFFRKRLKFGAWNGSGGLYGTKTQVAEARRLIKEALRGKVAKLQFLDDKTMRLASRFAKPYTLITGWDLSRTLELVKPVYGLMRGEPTAKPLESTYWRKRAPVPENPNPDRDGCGLLWCAPTAPIRGQEVTEVCNLAQSTLLAHGFEPMMSLTLITPRTVACVITIAYDRSLTGEDVKAMTCYRELVTKLMHGGFYSYRLGIQSMSGMGGNDAYGRFLQTMKDALDPNAIMAPGRYQTSSSMAKAAVASAETELAGAGNGRYR